MGALEDVGRALSGRIGGRHTSAMARAGLKVDTTELKKLSKELDVVKSSVVNLRKEMDALSKSSAAAMGAARGASQGGGTRTGAAGTVITTTGVNSSLSSAPGATTVGATPASAAAGAMGGGGAGGGGGGLFSSVMGGRGAGALALGGMILGGGIAAMDKRIDSNRGYAANIDRLNMVLQQQTGLSQNQVMNQMRKPLANYKLGANGISEVLAFQNQYGRGPGGQSVEALRALSGYSKSTADVLQDASAMMNPDVANRMYRMTGTSIYKPGGGMNDPIKMYGQLSSQFGLTSQKQIAGAKQMGSNTRSLMTDAGIPQEVQDEILAYASSNLIYKQKGGKGNYDPANKNARKLMGIEGNLANQTEETDRLRAQRDENMARRQLDNYAALEKSNQKLIKALGSLEETFSGLIGARASSRGWTNILGTGAKLVGAGLMATTSWTGIGAGVGAGLYAAGSVVSGNAGIGDGDPGSSSGGGSSTTKNTSSANDDKITIPVGYSGKRATLNQVKQRGDFKTMNPKMQERLLSMFRTNPNVGIGGGSRDSKQQENLFKSRYRRTSSKTDIHWDGSYWEHVSGAAAAPPGRSMHEIGLAADLIGDIGWMNANAGKFGLKHFAGVNNEPWHVQPAELPNSRRKYEESGAAWGTDGSFDSDGTSSNAPVTGVDKSSAADEHGGSGSSGGMMMRNFAGMSVSDIISIMREDAAGRLGGPMGLSSTPGSKSKGVGSVTGTSATAGSGTLPGVEVARAAGGAGFRGEDLIKMVAIAKRESRWNPRAYNGNLSTGDQSYGLWQLNTLNSKKGGMMGDLVNSILGNPKGNTNFDALFDPNTNARVAHEFYKRNGNTLRPWGGYKGVSDTHGADKYIQEATAAVKEAGLGDPFPGPDRMPMGRPVGSGGGNSTNTIHNSPTYQITVSPVINFSGTPATPDLRQIANQVTSMIQDNVRKLEMRGA